MTPALQCVWRDVGAGLREEAADFWIAEGALQDREQALLRADRLLVIARDGAGRIAAVSTAYREAVPHFGFSFYFVQMYIGKRHRRPGLAQRLLRRGWDELNRRFSEGESRETLGMMVEVANPKAMRVRSQTVWRDLGMEWVYVGKSSRGMHLRVWYFADSRVPV